VTLLGLDTSTPATVVGLLLDDGTLLEASDQRGAQERPGHQEGLLARAGTLLERAGLTFGDVDRVAVGIGPGGYTGLRVGIASARGLAQALEAEVVGVSSLQALAHGVALGGSRARADHVLTVVDARRGEVFTAAYRLGSPSGAGRDGEGGGPGARTPMGEATPAPEVLSGACAIPPEAVAGLVRSLSGHADTAPGHGDGDQTAGARWLAVGNAAGTVASALTDAGIEVPPPDSPCHRLGAHALCLLGTRAVAQGLEQVLPEYCRRPDAEIALEDGRLGRRADSLSAGTPGEGTAAAHTRQGRRAAGVTGVAS